MVLLVLVIGESNLTFGESRKCRLNAENWIAPLLFFCFGRSEGSSSACKCTQDICRFYSQMCHLWSLSVENEAWVLSDLSILFRQLLTNYSTERSRFHSFEGKCCIFPHFVLFTTEFWNLFSFDFETFCVLLDFSEVCFVVMHQNFGNQKYLTFRFGERNLWPNRWHLISASVMACFDCVSVFLY